MGNNKILRTMRPLLIGLLFAIPANFANAQNFGKKLLVLPNAGPPAEKTSAKQSGVGSLTAATDKTLNGASALSSFYLNFTNGDHKIRSITLYPQTDTVNAGIADNDSNDSFDFAATWWNIPGAVSGIVNFPMGSAASQAVPDGPANTTLVINGFSIAMDGGHDCDIESLRVGYSKEHKNAVLAPGLKCNDRKWGFISYSWIPNSYIKENKIVTGSDRQASTVSGILPPNDRYMIREFNFRFKNGGHHLQGIGVNLAAPNGEVVTWQDSNRDDPIEWKVEYSTLK